MCGILAIFSDQVDIAACHRGLNQLNHRGPDGSSTWNSQRVFLGHTRLSIRDLSAAGTQPFTLGPLVAVINGEFYDYDFLASVVRRHGHELRSTCDSEVLLHLYQLFGLECVKLLNGEWAFVIWDAQTGDVIAARDKFGAKPLYRYLDSNCCMFASEVKAFTQIVPLKLSQNYHYAGDPTRGLTVFQNVTHVLPGTLQHGCPQRLSSFDIGWGWTPPPQCQVETDDRAPALLAALDRAVGRRLVSDVPVGICLSGGVDSSLLLALMLRHVDNVHVFSVRFPGDELNDESEYIDAVIKFHQERGAKLVPHFVDVDQRTIPDTAMCAWCTETPLFDNTVYHLMELSKCARNHGIPVLLCGQGADELLGGYYWLVDDRRKSPVHPSIIEWLPYENVRKNLAKFMSSHSSQSHSSFEAALWFQQRSMFNDVLNIRGDRVEMQNSVEGRLPFLDLEVVQLVNSFVAADKVCLEPMIREKHVLYEAARGLVPPLVYNRKKHMFRQVDRLPPDHVELRQLFTIYRSDIARVSSILQPEDQETLIRMQDALTCSRPGLTVDRADFVRLRNLLSLANMFNLEPGDTTSFPNRPLCGTLGG